MQLPGATRLLVLMLVAACALLLPQGAAAAGSKRAPSGDAGPPRAHKSSGEAARHRRSGRQVKRRAARGTARRRTGRQLRGGAKRRLGLSRGKALKQAKPKTATVAENPEILFRGDFEAGFDGWHVQSISSRATLFSGGSFQGAGAARFEVQDGDIEPETGSERSEVEGATFDAGQDLYIRDAIRVPSADSYEGPWQIVQQLHETDWDGSPGVAVFLDEDNALAMGSGDGETSYWEGPELQHDRWYDLVYRVYLSQDSDEGFVEVWLDGVQQTLEDGETRAYGQTIQTAQTYIKAGVYRSRSSTGTSLVEHDGIVVGTSLAAVTAG